MPLSNKLEIPVEFEIEIVPVPIKETQAFAALCFVSVTGLVPSLAVIVSALNSLMLSPNYRLLSR